VKSKILTALLPFVRWQHYNTVHSWQQPFHVRCDHTQIFMCLIR